MKTLKSKITTVTIFTDRAQITRTAKISLAKGEHTVAFSDLPKSIEQKSIQVAGRGEAVLNDIKFKKVYFEEIQDSEIKALFDKIEEINKNVKIIDDELLQGQKEKQLVEKIAEYSTSTPESEGTPPILEPEKWLKMVNFYRRQLEEIDKETREANEKKKDLNNKIYKLNNEIKQLGNNRGQTKNQVQVVLQNNNEKELTLILTYIVYGATWYPVYDLRVSTEAKKMDISYNAMVEQNTGEDWENIKINLSTAQVQISGKQPELSPWYIDIYTPPPEEEMREMYDMKKKGKRRKHSEISPKSESVMDKFDMMIPAAQPPPPMKKPQAKVETVATSVLFNIAGTNTIKSEKTPHKLSIILKKLPAEFTYATVPKLSQYAYLKAKVTNTTDFPFLAGESNIFLDGSFVATSYLKLVAPSEEFTTSLGVDEGMKVEYKLIKKYEKSKGLISKKRNLNFEYQLIITNNKKHKEKIIIHDQLPISQNDDIKVELIKPKYKENTDSLKLDKQKFIKWIYEIASKEKLEIDFIYAVESPEFEEISGIDI